MTANMKKVFLICYSLFLILFLDSLQINPIFGFSQTILFLMYGLGFFFLLTIRIKRQKKVLLTRSRGIIGILILYYAYMAAHPGTSTYLLFMSILMVLIIYINYRFIQINDCLFEFIKMSFMVPAAYLLVICLIRNINIFSEIRNVNLVNMFSGTNRYRTNFGFYNINGMGNLVACNLCVSLYPVVSLFHSKDEQNMYNKASLVIMIITEIFLTIILLLSNSRNAIITVIVSIVVYLYFALTVSRPMSSASKLIYKLFLTTIIAVAVIVSFLPMATDMFTSSGRMNSILINIQTLDSTQRRVFGLGLISGYSGTSFMGHYMTTIDNFYLYTLVCGGFLGVCLMVWFFIKIAKGLYSCSRKNSIYYVIFANFVSLLISGIGETCVLYPLFPSCIIFWSIIFSTMDGIYETGSVKC